ncbi:peptidase S8 [Sphaerisporangium siamense]|uniref:Subtilisin family serine protease n=1 Tax=Sphaerisporangium siamense TaxID=795645 RepID=A0A7W7GB28_9ACTN|nr:S8 family serine peptidase [Sphaerisporangium siamense]MBB4704633.1 subtilisin family serine protease [Sphaerisporangium siamense]GII86247.1 peptidase S8 [Sphaerisporangium siamense]
MPSNPPPTLLSRTRRSSRSRRALAVAASLVVVGAIIPAVPASAAPTPGPETASTSKWKATALTPADRVQGAKSPSGKLAKSDTALFKATGSAPVNVVVKLDYDSLAAYKGGVDGLKGTSPSVTGKSLDVKSDAAKKYEKHIEGVENAFLSALAGNVPSAKAGQRLRTVYGGIAVKVPANKAVELLKLPGVAAVQEDRLQQPLTDSSPDFIGAPTIYNKLGGSPSSGKGVVFGSLDSGAWPEHPSFKDPGNLPAPPPTKDGTPRVCDFGDNPLTPATDVFVCNNKLIGGRPFLDTYNAVYSGEVYPDSARDSNGHGTHTATTTAGGPVADANPLGISRGPIHGIAPAAAVSVYKVCGAEGCFPSDSAAAVGRAILDGVRVINFSISGGSDPYSDPVELAFLDAYAAGVFVSTSAGNSGPGAGTTDHRAPWVTTVAASTQTRTYRSTVTLTGTGGATATVSGASITAGVDSPLRIVSAAAPPYSDPLCQNPAPPGLFSGKIVACQRGPNRVLKSFAVRQGGAAGMILYNSTPLDVMTDNHWLPTVHIDQPDSTTLLNFLAANPGATAKFTQGTKTTWQGDAITSFSSRGPGGDFLKPDVTAPGLHILAGTTPTPESPLEGPPGNYYQVIAGTSMSAPHVAGAGALLFALHPDWTPGQVKSALETTAKTAGVTKQDRTTPADPFDHGGGRIDLTKAGDPGLTLDETAANYAASSNDPLNRIDLNVPSVNAPVMPGVITAKRKVTNVSGKTLAYTATGTAPNGASVTVLPPLFSVKPGKTAELTVVITAADLPDGQYFGQVNLKQVGGSRDLHLPVAFYRQEGAVPVDQTCAPATIARNTGESTCTVTVENTTLKDTEVTALTTLDAKLRLNSVTGATKVGTQIATTKTTLAARQPDKPGIAPGIGPAGYIPLDVFGITPTPIGDEEAINFTVPAFVYAGKSYNRIGVVSNGYSIPGGSSGSGDVSFTPQTLPDVSPPNNVLASYWTDLDGTGAPGILAGTLTDGVSTWLVLEWRVHLYGQTGLKVFQQWIGVNGAEDITYAYDPTALPGDPGATYGLTVGAENAEGTAGGQISGPPTEDYRVQSTPGAPGGKLTYTLKVKGVSPGVGSLTTATSTAEVKGITVEVDKITVQ